MHETKMLSREDILRADDLPKRTVAVPEWGGAVIVRALSGEERDAFESEIVTILDDGTREPQDNIRAKLVARTVVDDSGRRMFSAGDVVALGQKSARALNRVFDVARELSGLTEDDVEELAKNSTPAPSADSGSA